MKTSPRKLVPSQHLTTNRGGGSINKLASTVDQLSIYELLSLLHRASTWIWTNSPKAQWLETKRRHLFHWVPWQGNCQPEMLGGDEWKWKLSWVCFNSVAPFRCRESKNRFTHGNLRPFSEGKNVTPGKGRFTCSMSHLKPLFGRRRRLYSDRRLLFTTTLVLIVNYDCLCSWWTGIFWLFHCQACQDFHSMCILYLYT